MRVLSTGSESRPTMDIQDIHAITSPMKTVKGNFFVHFFRIDFYVCNELQWKSTIEVVPL